MMVVHAPQGVPLSAPAAAVRVPGAAAPGRRRGAACSSRAAGSSRAPSAEEERFAWAAHPISAARGSGRPRTATTPLHVWAAAAAAFATDPAAGAAAGARAAIDANTHKYRFLTSQGNQARWVWAWGSMSVCTSSATHAWGVVHGRASAQCISVCVQSTCKAGTAHIPLHPASGQPLRALEHLHTLVIAPLSSCRAPFCPTQVSAVVEVQANGSARVDVVVQGSTLGAGASTPHLHWWGLTAPVLAAPPRLLLAAPAPLLNCWDRLASCTCAHPEGWPCSCSAQGCCSQVLWACRPRHPPPSTAG